MSGITLGVVAICKNEERDLPGFLNHLLPWVDEIVIVDDGSTDRSREIVLAAGDKVKLVEHRKSEEGGFAELRNVGIEASESDWLLHMDIDERVTPELAEEILREIPRTHLYAFRYRRLNFFLHRPMRGGEWVKWNQPRLARRGVHRFQNRLHERCVVDGAPNSIGQLKGFMWHLNDENYLERMEKSFAYSQIEAERLKRKRQISWLDVFFSPLWTFVKNFVFKRGFIDGVPGLILALHSAEAIFRSYALAWDAQNRIARNKLEEDIQLMWDEQTLNRILQLRGNPEVVHD